jgi:hypothetical protein
MATAVNGQALRNGQRRVGALSRRSGTLWEDWYKASLVDGERYLLVCYCYVELNPVRAHMVSHPGDYLWSSYRAHAYGEARQVVRDHELYRQLGRTVTERCNAHLTYAAVEKNKVSYSARYCMGCSAFPPLAKGGEGGFMAVVRRASAAKSPSFPLLQRGKAELQPSWAAHGIRALLRRSPNKPPALPGVI